MSWSRIATVSMALLVHFSCATPVSSFTDFLLIIISRHYSCDQPCPPGFYGNRCNQTCACENNATCNHIDGTCTCAPGWKGKLCNAPCLLKPTGEYDCDTACTTNCQNGGKCNETSAQCRLVRGTIDQPDFAVFLYSFFEIFIMRQNEKEKHNTLTMEVNITYKGKWVTASDGNWTHDLEISAAASKVEHIEREGRERERETESVWRKREEQKTRRPKKGKRELTSWKTMTKHFFWQLEGFCSIWISDFFTIYISTLDHCGIISTTLSLS